MLIILQWSLIIFLFFGNKLIFVFKKKIAMAGNQDWKSAKSIYDFEATNIKGEVVPLSKYVYYLFLNIV